MGGGGGITGTTGLGSTNTSGTPVTTTTGGTHIINLGTISQEIILGSQESQPSLTVIDANPNQNSQSNTCFDPTQCPGQNKPAKPDVASLALTFLIGVSFAGILWYISLRNLGMSFMLRGDSQIQRMKKNKQQYLEQQSLLKTYKKIAFAISMANNHTDALAYKEATAELEIFGSTKTVDANKILTSLLADPKANNIDIANAKNYLVHCIRTDLGLN